MCERRLVRTRVGVVAAAAALLVAACSADEQASSGGGDKAGGAADPVVLTMADFTSGLNYEPAVQYFVDQVDQLSGGSLQIDVSHEWGDFADDAEQQVVGDVAAGKVDLAWVGTRVFDTLGLNSLRALTAPMLIDSYPLERAVIASDIPGEMLADLDDVGVTGIAVLADGLRKPIAVDQPLMSPDDYADITFTALRSKTHAQAIRALGAIPGEALARTRKAGLTSGDIQGFEMSLHHYAINELQDAAPYVTANVNLWPQTVALIANPDALDDVNDDQREWLMQAGADSAKQSTDLVDDDAQRLADLCESGARFANASDADLAAMRAAFEPVLATLEDDPATEDFITRIEELKQATDPGPALDIPAGCTGPAPVGPTESASADPAGGDAAALDGTYRWTLTKEDALAHGEPSDQTEEGLAGYPTVFTMTLDDGVWALHAVRPSAAEVSCNTDDCTFVVDGNRITFNWPHEGLVFEFTFTTDDDGTLHLRPAGRMATGDAFVWSTRPWERIG
jgi:TRAP-type C4-dicarboxylate transport system substrate-binding protein